MGDVLGRGNSMCKVLMAGGKKMHWRKGRKATLTRIQGTVLGYEAGGVGWADTRQSRISRWGNTTTLHLLAKCRVG